MEVRLKRLENSSPEDLEYQKRTTMQHRWGVCIARARKWLTQGHCKPTVDIIYEVAFRLRMWLNK